MALASAVSAVQPVLLCFLISLTLASAFLNADQEDSDDNKIGSGSGIGPSNHEHQPQFCRFGNVSYSTASYTLLPSVTARAQCYSLCISEYDETKHNMLSLFQLKENCSLYNQVYLCQEGCELSLISDKTLCTSDCFDSCKISSFYLPDSLCPRLCLKEVCMRGCELFEEIKSQNDTEDLLPIISNDEFKLVPYSSPYLHASGAYQFVYDASSLPKYSNKSLVSFILEVVPVSNSEVNVLTTYYWLSDTNDVFVIHPDLINDRVVVRFALVNKFGRGNFSSFSNFLVYGGLWRDFPDQPLPHLIQWTMMDDNRQGYWEQALINISWQKPYNYQYLVGYHIQIDSPSEYCGDARIITIEEHSHPFAVWEGRYPGDSPLNNCTYSLKILSLPYQSRYWYCGVHQPFTIRVSTSTNLIPPGYSFDLQFNGSQRQTNDYDWYVFSFYWTLPIHPLLIKGIVSFKIHIATPDRNDAFWFIDKNTETFTFSPIHSYDEGIFLFKLETVYDLRTPNTLRYIKGNLSLSFDARPFPPPPPVQVALKHLWIFNASLIRLLMMWHHAERIDPSSIEYYIHVGLEELHDEPIPNNGTVCWFNTSMLPLNALLIFLRKDNLMILSVAINAVIDGVLPLKNDNWTLFLQVMAVRVPSRRYGKWSYPLLYYAFNDNVKHSNNTMNSSTIIVTSTPGNSASTSFDYRLYFTPILILPAGLIVIIATIIFGIKVYIKYRSTLEALHHCQLKIGMHIKDDGKSKWEIPHSSIQSQVVIGKGTLGTISKALVRKSRQDLETFVLTLEEMSDGGVNAKAFYRQIRINKELSHLNLLTLLHTSTMTYPHILVTEFCSHGDLLSTLHHIKEKNSIEDPLYSEENNCFSYLSDVTSTDLISFLQQLSSAMVYLSSRGVVHGDLACRNAYITSDKTVKLSQFGVARCIPRKKVYTIENYPTRWMPIESLANFGKRSSEADVWSFGVMGWEVVTLGDFPYSDITDDRHIVEYLESGERLQCPQNCSHDLYSLFDSCWNKDIALRPSFTQINDTLVTLSSKGTALMKY